jgi:hypothetical protein
MQAALALTSAIDTDRAGAGAAYQEEERDMGSPRSPTANLSGITETTVFGSPAFEDDLNYDLAGVADNHVDNHVV